jgi:UDP-N-acetylmuramate: L-alanyl-gamma-D-glutamyl-meso-diaminopimelate ligase
MNLRERMRLHLFGICGTFMAGLALIAREQGHVVSGSDENIYPPMSTMLDNAGIKIAQGYSVEHLDDRSIDLFIVGNTMKRGMEVVECLLERGLPYQSGPEWLGQNVLSHKSVIAVSGTHGKTTTCSLITWILTHAGLNPSYLIGGVPGNLERSASLTDSPYFVIEADEYDTAFFDKRSKFLHYHPNVLAINNLEFDHADIFSDLRAVQDQFHFLLRILPRDGMLFSPYKDKSIQEVVDRGFWSNQETFLKQGDWVYKNSAKDGSKFDIHYQNQKFASICWSLIGEHNQQNSLVAAAVCHQLGIKAELIEEALRRYINVKRRLEYLGVIKNLTFYDDFAHHPTAIKKTISALRNKIGNEQLIIVLRFASYTMRKGVHCSSVIDALSDADKVYLFDCPNVDIKLSSKIDNSKKPNQVQKEIAEMSCPTHVVSMSNRASDNFYYQFDNN